MQLILDSEPTLAINRDMAAVDEIHTEKAGNGDIKEIKEIICNGHKENTGEVNVITNDDENKQITSGEIDALHNEDSTETVIIAPTYEINSPETNNGITEESNNNGIDEQNQITKNESEAKSEEVRLENEEEIIRIKHEDVDDIPKIKENEPGIDAKENDTTKTEELLSDTEEGVEVIKEPAERPAETINDKELKEPTPEVVLEEPERTIENKDKQLDETKCEVETPECDSTEEVSSKVARDSSPIELKDDMEVEEIVDTMISNEQDTNSQVKEKSLAPVNNITHNPILCKLSNTLDILSDDEEEPPNEAPKEVESNEKQCIDIEDDDDIMVIDEDTSKTETPQPVHISNKEDTRINTDDNDNDSETGEKINDETIDLFSKNDEKDPPSAEEIKDESLEIVISEKEEGKQSKKFSPDVPLLPDNFLKSAKKNLADMTREDLEEFCILKIVESVVDRSNLSDIKNKLKTLAQGIEEYRRKALMLSKQNRDLQVVLKSIQEEQKNSTPGTAITPLKITRSVGMQVFMEKTSPRKKSIMPLQNCITRHSAKSLPTMNTRTQKLPNLQSIPVPRLVPANSPAIKSPNGIPILSQITPGKTNTPMPNGVKNPSPSQKAAEKRQFNRNLSVTVDLTDDEPPAKMKNLSSPAPPVRVVPSQNLMANPRQAFPAGVSNPRKVYIPISGPQSQNIRPGQTIMLKSVPTPGLRPRCPTSQLTRLPGGSIRMNRVQTGRHPAPLPESMKQYQPPNWKALPPAPDLKLSKVENGIVISWKIEGYQEDSYEEIASYQLYAYQETSSPPSTTLWKKIGDVKALPLPMACTLTQFMAGFKYFFAVRAVDIRSRLGPFSLPGSILLLNKL